MKKSLFIRFLPWSFAVCVAMAVLFSCSIPVSGAYDATLPADNSKIASAPAMIRENMRALKDDGITNAQRVASWTPVQIGPERFWCVASTTSTNLLNATGTHLNVGTTTGTYNVFFMADATATITKNLTPFGMTGGYTVYVATTTELVGSTGSPWSVDASVSQTSTWTVGIATSSTRGQIIMNAQGEIGASWTMKVWVNGHGW